MLKLLTTRRYEGCPASPAARSLEGMHQSFTRVPSLGNSRLDSNYKPRTARGGIGGGHLPAYDSCAERAFDRRANLGGALHDVDACLSKGRHLLDGRSLATRDDGARVSHAASRRRRLSGDEADDRLLEMRLDPGGGVLLGV